MNDDAVQKYGPGTDASVFSAFAENTDSLVALCTWDGEVSYINSFGLQMLGITEADQVASLRAEHFFHLNDKKLSRDDVPERVRNEGSWRGERRLRHFRTGEEIPVVQTCFVIPDAQGVSNMMGIMMRDLRRERELVGRLGLFKKAVESSTEGIFIVDAKRTERPIIYVNPAFTKITGYQIQEAIGRHTLFLQGDDPSPELDIIRKGLAEKHPARALVKSQRKDGRPFWNQVSISPVKDNLGETTHFVGVQLDVSEEQNAKENLHAETQRMQLVLTSIELGVWEWEAGSDRVKWDNQMFALHRVKRSATPDPMEAWNLRLHPDDLHRMRREIANALDGKETYIAPVRIVLDNGDVRFVRLLSRLIRGSAGQSSRLIGVCWDVTKEMKTKDIIEDQQMQIQAQARLASLGEMAGGIAHEINNPLSIIAAYMDRLRESVVEGSPDPADMLHIVNRITLTVHRIAGIIKGLRIVAREGSHDPHESTSVRSLFNDTLGLCSERCRNLGIQVQIEGDVDTMLDCRIVQISQVLTNLISNAIHAVENRSTKWIRLSATSEDQSIVIRIADSGAGIAPEARSRIFEPFFTTKEPGKGTGLGLSISTSIIKDHGGSLTLDLVKEGTTFAIRLPKEQAKAKAA